MPTVKVHNLKNEEVGEVQLSDIVFGAPLNQPLIHAAVRNFMANARQGTSATKTRGDVSGSGRKLWKQKGTGRARIASLRSPLWKGGGNAHDELGATVGDRVRIVETRPLSARKRWRVVEIVQKAAK